MPRRARLLCMAGWSCSGHAPCWLTGKPMRPVPCSRPGLRCPIFEKGRRWARYGARRSATGHCRTSTTSGCVPTSITEVGQYSQPEVSVEVQGVPAFALELKEVGVAGQSHTGIPDSTSVITSWNPGEDWSEERGAVDVNRRGSDIFAHLLHPRVMALAYRVVVVGGFSGLRQLARQAQFVERLGNHCGEVRIALVVDASAHGGVEG